MLTSTDFRGLLNKRFFQNFLPVPAFHKLYLEVGTPNFELPDVKNGVAVKLSDYKGKQPVILAFTRIFTEKQYCPFCYPHIIALNDNYEKFVEKGVELLLITSTDEEQSKIIVNDLGLKMPLLSNPSCSVFHRYGTGQSLGAPLPAQFVLDKEGKLKFAHLFSFLDHNAGVERLLEVLEVSASVPAEA
ncbi:MAG TPA: redoxin domain-containing protein [Oscillatoriaceae cyanobacterium M33_DOE_052]|uniref:Peroxiredoxin family protein n=1 Tax=Planktothricoides sp. SpSt-374 TaxID=2282167 RepID=A0A7C3ZQA9_9CYAN|nr:redoxin domain-containing protein [Oscillatoriaceae cyanobacterium M33_DOE_052]